MKKKVLTIAIIVAGIVSISGIGLALNAHQSLNLSVKENDTMYAEVKEPVYEDNNYKQDNEDIDSNTPVNNQEGITIDEVQSGSKDTSQNIDKAKNKDLVINKTSRDIAKSPVQKIDGKAVADDKSLAKEDIKEEDSQNPKEGLQNDQNSSKPAGLSREDALNFLKEKNNKVDYSYMGDENTYSVLKEKGHEGYVFLPNAPTDLGMFVNKNTKEIYYFHPSGYMDIY
ncbi:hypothetical protein [Peptostreptococcus stomatis]